MYSLQSSSVSALASAGSTTTSLSTSAAHKNSTTELRPVPRGPRIPRPTRLYNVSNASTNQQQPPKRRPLDKYTQVARELPALFATHSVSSLFSDDERYIPSSVTDALAELHAWALDKPENIAKLARTLRAADMTTPINFTSQTQIGYNLAAADVDGHIKRYDKEPEVMRAVGACVVEAWAELGHALVESEEWCGDGFRCCCLQ